MIEFSILNLENNRKLKGIIKFNNVKWALKRNKQFLINLKLEI